MSQVSTRLASILGTAPCAILWLDMPHGLDELGDYEIFRVASSSLVSKTWNKFVVAATKISTAKKHCVLATTSQAALNALRHGFLQLGLFRCVVISDLGACLKTRHGSLLTNCPTATLFREYYWPFLSQKGIEAAPTVIALSDLSLHWHLAMVAQRRSNSHKPVFVKDIMQELSQEFNVEVWLDARQSASPPVMPKELSFSIRPGPQVQADRLQGFGETPLLKMYCKAAQKLFSIFGSASVSRFIEDISADLLDEENYINNALSVDAEFPLVKLDTWKQRHQEIRQFISRCTDAYVNPFRAEILYTQYIYDYIWHYVQEGGVNALLLVDSELEAKNLKSVLTSYLEIDPSHSERMSYSLWPDTSYPSESANMAPRVFVTTKSNFLRPSTVTSRPPLYISTLFKIGSFRSPSEVAFWNDMLTARPASSHAPSPARLFVLAPGHQVPYIAKLQRAIGHLLTSPDAAYVHGRYEEIFGKARDVAAWLELHNSRPSSPKWSTKGFDLSEDATWDLVHRYLHWLQDSSLRTGPPFRISWSTPTKLVSSDALQAAMYKVTATLPLHAAWRAPVESEAKPTISAARRSAVFLLAQKLFSVSAFDPNLLPTVKCLPPPATLSLGPRKAFKAPVGRKPVPVLAEPLLPVGADVDLVELFYTIGSVVDRQTGLDPHAPLVSSFFILSHSALFDASVSFNCTDKEHLHLKCIYSESKRMTLETKQVTLLKGFHEKLVQIVKLSTPMVVDWSKSAYQYLIAPCIYEDGQLSIDWSSVIDTVNGFDPKRFSSWLHAYVYYPHEPKQRYLVNQVDFDSTPKSPCAMTPEITVAEAMKAKHNFTITDLDQPLLKVRMVSSKCYNSLLGPNLFQKSPEPETAPAGEGEINFYRNIALVPEMLVVWLRSNMPHDVILILPSLLHRLENLLRISHFLKQMHLDFLPLPLALTATTTTGTVEETNLEVIETLGDMLLKFVVSHHVVRQFPDMTVAPIDYYRHYWIANATLCALGAERELPLWINSVQFTGKLLMPGLADPPANQFQTALTEKSVADCVEALIFACFEAKGVEGMFRHLEAFGVGELRYDFRATNDPLPPLLPDSVLSDQFSKLQELESMIGYRFRDKRLLIESMTHETASSMTASSSQRSFHGLSFLGDSIFDYFIVLHHTPKVLTSPTPGDMTYLKSIGVSGWSQALLAEKVLHLSDFLVYHSPTLATHLKQYKKAISALVVDKTPYWRLTGMDFPEALVMALEALVGAVFLDCGRNLERTWQVFSPLFSPYWEVHAKYTTGSIYPKNLFSYVSACKSFLESPPIRLKYAQAYVVHSKCHSHAVYGISSTKRVAQSDSSARLYQLFGGDAEASLAERVLQQCDCKKDIPTTNSR